MDKFVVIAATLSPATADADTTELASLKAVRDGIVHELAGQETFPAERAQRLLRKYLELHLTRDD